MDRKKFNRRDFLRISALTAAGPALASCAPSTPQVVEVTKIVEGTPVVETVVVEKTVVVEVEKEVTPVPAQPEGPAKVTVWGWWEPRMAVFDGVAKKFMEANPDVEVEVVTLPEGTQWEKILPSTAAGTGPTIFKNAMERYWDFVTYGVMEAYPEDIFPNSWWKENFTDTWEDNLYEGKVYVYVSGSMPTLFFYNKAMLGDKGLDPNTPPTTWDELVTMGKKLVETDAAGKITIAGFIPADAAWLNFAYQLGGSLVEVKSDGTRASAILSEESVKAFRFLADLYVTHKVTPSEFPWLGEAVGTSVAAMASEASWIIGSFQSDFPDVYAELGWAFPPTPTGKPEPSTGVKENVLEMSVMTARPPFEKQAAFRYLEYLLKQSDQGLADVAALIGAVPGKVGVRALPMFQESEAIKTVVELLPSQKNAVQLDPGLFDLWTNARNRVVLEGTSVEESLQIADQELTTILGEGRLRFMQ